jgi:hypothetical protein
LVSRFGRFLSYDSSLCSSFCFAPFYRHCTVHTTDGSPLSGAGQGTLCSDSFHVSDFFLVLDLTIQLMSAGQITDHDYHVILDPDFCYIQDHRMGHLVGTGPQRHDSQHLWELDWLRLPPISPASLASPAITALSTSSFSQWHHRLGHLCGSRFSTLFHRGLLRSVSGRPFLVSSIFDY